MKLLQHSNYTVRPHYSRILKTIFIFLAILYFLNPVLLLNHTKALGRFMCNRYRHIQYEYTKSTRGSTIADFIDAKNTWAEFGNGMKKAVKDFASLWR